MRRRYRKTGGKESTQYMESKKHRYVQERRPRMRSDYYNSIRALLFVTMIAYMVIMCVAE